MATSGALPLSAQSATPAFRYLGPGGEPFLAGPTDAGGLLNERGESLSILAGTNQRTLAWTADASGRIHRVGFWEGAHRAADGSVSSRILDLTETGLIHGISVHYTPASGATAWWGTTRGHTRRVGFYDVLHTRADGFHRSRVHELIDCGWMVGFSERYAGDADAGGTAWIANICGWIRPIGIHDAMHTDDDGRQASEPRGLNARGYAIGSSEGFFSASRTSSTAWIAAPDGRTWRVGYYDPKHVAPDGYWSSHPHAINTAGDVLGTSWRFVGYGGEAEWGGDLFGQSCWVANVRGAIHRVGLYDADHKSPDDFHHQAPLGLLTESGYVAGSAVRYDVDGARAGWSGWIANRAGVTRRVGFYDGPYRSDDGFISNQVSQLNEAGTVAGHAVRYEGAQSRGMAAWIGGFDRPARRVGLTDAGHTDPDGTQISYVQHLFNNGTAIGYSMRTPVTHGMSTRTFWAVDPQGALTVLGDLGTASLSVAPHGIVWWGSWVYDTNSRQRIEPGGRIFGVSRGGVIFGQSPRNTAFVWIPGRGHLDIAENLDVSIQDHGWERLGSVMDVSASGHILGTGLRRGSTNNFATFLVRLIPR